MRFPLAVTRASKPIVAALLLAALPSAGRAEDAPGVFKIPGTESTIKFYGYVQLDATVDFAGRPYTEDGDWATFLPAVPPEKSALGKKHPQTYMTARQSRFGLQTSTPSSYGNIGVKLEGDFNAPNAYFSESYTNSVLFRIRHAYATVGNALIGQTWSTFLDLGAAPDTVDFNGPGSLALVRNPMIRYGIPLAPGATLALAVENNRGQQYANSSTDATRFQEVPDFHANLTYGGSWGHLSLRGVTQDFTRQVGAAGSEKNKSKFGVSGAVSGSAKLGGDTLVAQFSGGQGIGRYLLNAANAGPVSVVGEDLKLWTVYAYHVGFTHVWSPEYRSNLVWSQTFIQDPKLGGVAADNTTQKTMSQAFVNTFWTMTKTVELGVEYVYGQWESFGPNKVKGIEHRANLSAHYNFF